MRVAMTAEVDSSGFDVVPDEKRLEYRCIQPMPSGSRYNTVLETIEYRQTSYVMPLFTATTVIQSVLRIRYPKNLLDVLVSTSTSSNLAGEHTYWGQEWFIKAPLLPRTEHYCDLEPTK